jgi:hypothetical protein
MRPDVRCKDEDCVEMSQPLCDCVLLGQGLQTVSLSSSLFPAEQPAKQSRDLHNICGADNRYRVKFFAREVNLDSPLFDGSLAECRQQLVQWRHARFGIIPPRPFFQKLHRCREIVSGNKLSFAALLCFYFIAQTIGSAGLLVLQWTINRDRRCLYIIFA